MNTPLISVIIPAYNAEETIRRACSSVLTQNYENVELIVVNDGSKDGTKAILEELEQRHANLHCIHQENGGVCKARNAGLEWAKGEYIAFLDADDELTPDGLTRLYTAAAEHDCDVVAGNFAVVYPDSDTGEKVYAFENSLSVWEGKEALARSLKDHPATYAVWSKLYRRAFAADVRFAEGRRIHEDSFFLFELFLHMPKMAVVDAVVLRQHMTPDSASRAAFSEKFLDILYFAKRKYEIIEKKYPEYQDLAKNVLVKASLALLHVMRTNEDPRYKATEKECIAVVNANANYFIPAILRDKILFVFVRFRLYGLYKALFRLR